MSGQLQQVSTRQSTTEVKTVSRSWEIAPGDRLLTMKQLREIVPKDKATIYRWIKQGIFPAGYQIGPQSVAWLRSEVMEWFATQARKPPS